MPHQINPPGVGGKKKKKGRAPKHQNSFAFRHNPKSKKTEKILSSPNVGVCRRCHEKIEWRKKYRKYKPRTQPGKCNICLQKNVLAAYHTICSKCTVSDAAISAMQNHPTGGQEPPCETDSAIDSEDSEDDGASHNSNDDELHGTECNEPELMGTVDTKPPKTAIRNIRVCAICTHEPAISKYNIGDGETGELLDRIQELEESLESGHDCTDEHKLSLREVKGVERQLEKLRLELKCKGKKSLGRKDSAVEDDDEDGEDGDDENDDGEEREVDSSDEGNDDFDDENDPLLVAVGGKDKLLVGEEYQKMILAREAG